MKHKEWMSEETWDVLNKRKERKKKSLDAMSQRLKDRLDQQYQVENQEVRRRSKAVKREPWPRGTVLAWHAGGVGFESPRGQHFVQP